MPVYLRKNVNYTPPSIDKVPVEMEDDFINDPDQLTDKLPQPYRMLDKILSGVIEKAWAIIEERENARLEEARKIKPPQYQHTVQVEEFAGATSIACTPDGNYIVLGLPNGLSVLNASTQEKVCSWEEEKVEIIHTEIYSMAENIYLLVTLDDMGLARLHTLAGDRLYLFKVMNEQQEDPESEEKATTKTLIHKCEASPQGEYLGALVEHPHSGEFYLEIHKLPRDNWVQEVEAKLATDAPKIEPQKPQDKKESKTEDSATLTDEATEAEDQAPVQSQESQETSHHQHSDKNAVKFSPTSLVMKLKPPATPAGNLAPSIHAACQKVDQGDVIGTGQNHILTTNNLDLRKDVFANNYKNLLEYLPKEEDIQEFMQEASFHFFNSGKLLYNPSEAPPNPESPTSVAVWWKGSTHIMHYSLYKQPTKEGEFKPDLVWPYTSKISTTTVSSDLSLLAVGFNNGNIIICDRYLGIQRGVVSVTTEAAIEEMWFLDPSMCPQDDAEYPPYTTKTSCFLLILCSDGAMFYMICSPGILADPMPITPRIEKESERFTKVAPFSGKQDLILVVLQSGKVQVRNTLQGSVLLETVLPQTHELYTPWDPIITTAANGQYLFLRGCPKDVEEGEEAPVEGKEEEVVKSLPGMLFVYSLCNFPTLDEYMGRDRKPLPFKVHTMIDKRLDGLMLERIAQQALRKTRMQDRWGMMREEIWSILQYKEEAKRKAEQRPVVNFKRVYHYQQD